MIGCARVRKLLCRYVDNELGCAESEAVKAHLESCVFCREELAGLSRIKEAVSGKERKKLPPDFMVCRLRREIAEDKRLLRNGLRVLSGIGELSRRIIPVPVTVIVLSIAFLILSSGRQTGTYSLDEQLLSGSKTTTETALALMLGACS